MTVFKEIEKKKRNSAAASVLENSIDDVQNDRVHCDREPSSKRKQK
jgi:hypothetical protein